MDWFSSPALLRNEYCISPDVIQKQMSMDGGFALSARNQKEIIRSELLNMSDF
jgi:hypothetical protein